MCFAPQRRALFRHLNFQKWSGAGVFYTFWLGNVFRARATFHLSSGQMWLRTRRFSEPSFRPSGATNHWKNAVFRDFPTFWRTCIFFLLTLSLLWSSLFCSSPLWLFPPLLFHLSILSEVWLLNFLWLTYLCLLFVPHILNPILSLSLSLSYTFVLQAPELLHLDVLPNFAMLCQGPPISAGTLKGTLTDISICGQLSHCLMLFQHLAPWCRPGYNL